MSSYRSPLGPRFGLVIDGLSGDELAAESAATIRSLLYEHKVLLFKGIKWPELTYIEFARKLGEPICFVDKEYRHPQHPEIFVVSNLVGRKFGMDRVGYYWHSDSSFLPQPLPITMLHAQLVPEQGGETSFIDMTAVLASLPSDLCQTIAPLSCSHEGKWRYLITEKDLGLSIEEILTEDERRVPSQLHPMIVTHPVTSRRALYLSEGVARRIVGMPRAKSDGLLAELWSFVRQSPARHEHRWERGDLVLWDNRSVVHRACPAAAGQDRQMFRIGVADGPFFGSRT